MSFRDEFQKIKNESFKVKLEYIFTYYWLPILLVAVLLITLLSQIVHFANQKKIVLYGHCVNAVYEQADSEQFLKSISAKMHIDENTSEIAFSNSLLSSEDIYSIMATHQLITAQIASGSLDFLAGDTETLLQYAYNESFCDLRTVLSAEQASTLSPYFLYLDQTLIERTSSSNEQVTDYPAPAKPEEMEKPIPFAVQIPEDSEFDRVYYGHTKDPIAIAILCNAPNMDATRQFVGLLFK